MSTVVVPVQMIRSLAAWSERLPLALQAGGRTRAVPGKAMPQAAGAARPLVAVQAGEAAVALVRAASRRPFVFAVARL